MLSFVYLYLCSYQTQDTKTLLFDLLEIQPSPSSWWRSYCPALKKCLKSFCCGWIYVLFSSRNLFLHNYMIIGYLLKWAIVFYAITILSMFMNHVSSNLCIESILYDEYPLSLRKKTKMLYYNPSRFWHRILIELKRDRKD